MIDNELNLRDDFEPTTYEAWRERVGRDLRGAPFDKRLLTRLHEGFSLEPMYSQQSWDHTGDPTGFPGAGCFTRGSTPTGSAANGWDIRQAQRHPDPAAIATALAEDLAEGGRSAHLCFDRSVRTLTAPAAEADGLVAWSVADLEVALAGVELAAVPLGLEAGAAAPLVAALLVALADRRGVDRAALRVDLGVDPLGALARDGVLPQGVDAALAEAGELAAWTAAHLPGCRALAVDLGAHHLAGATAVQTLGWSLATGVAYLRALTAAGLDAAAAARQLTFVYRTGADFSLGVATLRAARALWARALEACGVPEADRGMRMHVRPAERALTQRDPWVNILRNTVACFTGATAGAEIIGSAPFDHALGVASSAQARRLARNTQLVLMEESNLHRVVDPAGGSWAIERLTATLSEHGWAELQRVERAGGMVAALTGGDVAQSLDAVAVDRDKAVAKRKEPLTGVSEFANLGETLPTLEAPDVAAIAQAAEARLASRDADALEAALAAIPRLPEAGVDALVAAAAAGATVVELGQARWGGASDTRVAPLPDRRLAARYEALRDRSDAHLAAHGARPRLFLANLGPIAKHTGRAMWTQTFYEAGGVEVISNTGFSTPEDAAATFADSGAPTAVVVSADSIYADYGVATAEALVAAGATRVMVAGRPGELEQAWRAAGVHGFVYLGCDVLQTLADELAHQGVEEVSA